MSARRLLCWLLLHHAGPEIVEWGSTNIRGAEMVWSFTCRRCGMVRLHALPAGTTLGPADAR